jgi:membrane-bound lytic murein transglycosylase A
MQSDRGDARAFQRGVVTGLAAAIICSIAVAASAEGPLVIAGSQLVPVKWSELAGWTADDHLAAFAAYQNGCRTLRKTSRTDDGGQIHYALTSVCRKAVDLGPQDSNTARVFFEQNFQPVRIARLGEVEGLLTGYFEPIVAGSRFPSPEFSIPLYRRPRDLVAAGYKPGSTAFPNKGVRISRRTANNELVPYHDRGAIEAGALDGQKLEICWLKDPFDLLAIQMEGSGRVILEDGTPLRVTYDSHNGYGYTSIERVLVERKFMLRKEMSRERMNAWMAAYPNEAAKVRATNRGYAFFRVTGLTNDGEPVGAQGVPLTPGRSIAVDRLHEYGTPFFIDANLPTENAKPASPFRRLMIAQDTGSAIVGPARADLYLGAGEDAGRAAARIHHPGRFVMLLPRELDLIAAGKQMPLPVPKPKIAEVEVAKRDGKGKTVSANAGAITAGRQMPESKTKDLETEGRRQDGKGNTVSANAGVVVGGRQMPLPVSKTKETESEGRTQDGKGNLVSANAGVIVSGRQRPLPAAKVTSPEIEVRKQDTKGNAVSANAGAVASGKQMPLPASKMKNSEIEVRKQDGKGKTDSANGGAKAAGKQMPLPASPTKDREAKDNKQDGNGKAVAANGAVAGEKQLPPPASKTKNAEIEAGKKDGKRKAVSVRVSENGKAAARFGQHAASARKSSVSMY